MSAKLNGSAERFAIALRDMVREAAGEALEPLKADIATLKTDVATLKTDVAEICGEVAQLQHRRLWPSKPDTQQPGG